MRHQNTVILGYSPKKNKANNETHAYLYLHGSCSEVSGTTEIVYSCVCMVPRKPGITVNWWLSYGYIFTHQGRSFS